MEDARCSHCHESDRAQDASYRRVLWLVLAINAAMFAVEIGAGLAAGSASLLADALDFLGDAANYAISLFVIGMALRYRALAALLKGASMAVFGAWVIGVIGWHAWHGSLPNAFTMGAVGVAALVANAASFALLWAYRSGDSNMRSAWICARNDVLGNLAGSRCGARRVRDGHGMAGCRSRGDHGEPRSARRRCGGPTRAARAAFATLGAVSR
jgi:Co/Zn/Cd efflux system component